MSDRWFDGTYYKREATVNYLDCNTEQKVFLHYILGIFSEIAGDESQSKGNTYNAMAKNGKVFLITRMSVRFHRIPAVSETLVFRTWYRGTDGKFYLRDCDVRSPEGELLASLSGTWVLFDLAERRVAEKQGHPTPNVRIMDEAADSPECKKILVPDHMGLLGARPVYYTDLDCNYHVNNAAYSAIAEDFLPPEYRDREIKDYVINFNKETRLGDTLEMRGGASGGSYIVQGSVGGVQHFAGEFTFFR